MDGYTVHIMSLVYHIHILKVKRDVTHTQRLEEFACRNVWSKEAKRKSVCPNTNPLTYKHHPAASGVHFFKRSTQLNCFAVHSSCLFHKKHYLIKEAGFY